MSATIEQISKTYDELPYMSVPFSQTAPEHLRTVAHLFGLDAPAPRHARVLELGCAAGGNCIPFAVRHPQATVIGVDLSKVQIDAGQRAIEAMGLGNIRLLQDSLANLGEELGEFDYVICHGVYSWVPEDVREAILRVASERLAANGVAYVSYNVYPGWKAKEIVRDAMLLRGGPREGPQEKLAYARGMIDFLHEMAHEGSVLQKIMQENIGMIRNGKPDYLVHEFLELCNAPCYFRDFLAAAGRYGLGYLAEAETSTMFTANYDPRVAEPLLRECGGSQEALEQLLDFLNNRTFRQTLLVRAERAGQIRYGLDRQRIAALHVAGRYEAVDGQPDQWRTHTQTLISTNHALTRQILADLNAAWPASVPVRALVKRAATQTSAELALTSVLDFVEKLIIGNALRYRLDPVTLPPQPPARPATSDALRRLAELRTRESVPLSLFNGWHDPVQQLDLVTERLLPLLDGQRELGELTTLLRQSVDRGELSFQRQGQPIEQPEELDAAADEHTRRTLQWLASNGMLEPGLA